MSVNDIDERIAQNISSFPHLNSYSSPNNVKTKPKSKLVDSSSDESTESTDSDEDSRLKSLSKAQSYSSFTNITNDDSPAFKTKPRSKLIDSSSEESTESTETTESTESTETTESTESTETTESTDSDEESHKKSLSKAQNSSNITNISSDDSPAFKTKPKSKLIDSSSEESTESTDNDEDSSLKSLPKNQSSLSITNISSDDSPAFKTKPKSKLIDILSGESTESTESTDSDEESHHKSLPKAQNSSNITNISSDDSPAFKTKPKSKLIDILSGESTESTDNDEDSHHKSLPKAQIYSSITLSSDTSHKFKTKTLDNTTDDIINETISHLTPTQVKEHFKTHDDSIILINDTPPSSKDLKKKIINDDQRMISCWSPNHEKIVQSPVVQKKPNKIEIIEIDDEKLKALEPTKERNFVLKNGSMIRGSNQSQTTRNYNYEQKLKLLSEEILEELAKKPDMDCQTYSQSVKPPKGLKVNLLKHQFYSLLWLKWRESTYPHGAILADDMGLGKTLTILCYLKLIIDEREAKQKAEYEKQMENDEDNDNDNDDNDDDNDIDKHSKKYLQTKKKKKHYRLLPPRRLKTLIVLPASLIHQWQSEINSRFERGSFKYHVYHEANRKRLSYNMEDNDIVFTTYDIVTREMATDTDGNLIATVSSIKFLTILKKNLILNSI
jgi:SNF2 family DNA or RNA helicase